MNKEIFNRIRKCINASLEHDAEHITLDMSLTDDLEMESLHIVTLQVELEDEFAVQFDPLEDDFFEIFQTVGSVYDAIERKLS